MEEIKKEEIKEILKRYDKEFLILLSFFFYGHEMHEIPFIYTKIDRLLKDKNFGHFSKDITQTYLSKYLYGFKAVSKSRAKRFFNKNKWYYEVFSYLNKITREINMTTNLLEPYIVRYITTDYNQKDKVIPYLKEVSELFNSKYNQLTVSKTAVKKNQYNKHPYADHEHLLKKILQPTSWAIVALHKDRVVGFGIAKLLEIVTEWNNVVELGGLIVHPEFRGMGVAENMQLLSEDYVKNSPNFDYAMASSTTLHPITTYLMERVGYKPIILELGGENDFYGYKEPGFGNCDFNNYLLFIKDFRKDIEKSKFVVFVNKGDYWLYRMEYLILGCWRKIVVLKLNKYPAPDKEEVNKFQERIDQIRKKGYGALFVDITRQESVCIMDLLKKNGFYLCGVLPVSQLDNKAKKDYAYFRYLSEDMTIYPFIFVRYQGIGTRFKYRLWHYRLRSIDQFNKARTKNKIPKLAAFLELYQLIRYIKHKFKNEKQEITSNN